MKTKSLKAKIGARRGSDIKVKTARGRKISSTRWLARQLNDPFVRLARSEGYASRAVYKLQEIDDKFRIIKQNQVVIDLGAAPGGWSQLVVERSKSSSLVIAIDLLEMGQISGVMNIRGDFADNAVIEELDKMLDKSNGKANLILSDMAANLTGNSDVDRYRAEDMLEAVLEFATSRLVLGGTLVIKIFRGGAPQIIIAKLKSSFEQVRQFKPDSSRKDSAEIYLVAKNLTKCLAS